MIYETFWSYFIIIRFDSTYIIVDLVKIKGIKLKHNIVCYGFPKLDEFVANLVKLKLINAKFRLILYKTSKLAYFMTKILCPTLFKHDIIMI